MADVTTPFEPDIFAVLGADSLPDEEKAALLARMFEVIQTKVFKRVYQMLSEDDREQLLEMMETENFEDVDNFLLSHVPNLENMYQEEGRILRQELILSNAA